jgi:hypothetical protein
MAGWHHWSKAVSGGLICYTKLQNKKAEPRWLCLFGETRHNYFFFAAFLGAAFLGAAFFAGAFFAVAIVFPSPIWLVLVIFLLIVGGKIVNLSWLLIFIIGCF